VVIDVTSINTGNGLQNKHAKSDEWFDAAKYAQIHFVSRSMARTGNGYQVTGDLDMHGVKKRRPFSLPSKERHKGSIYRQLYGQP